MLTDSYKYDNLLAGDFPRVSATGIVASGVSLKRGAVLGKITGDAGAKQVVSFVLSDFTAEDDKKTTLTIGETAYDFDSTAESTLADVLDGLVALVAADDACVYGAEADAETGKLTLTAKEVGAHDESEVLTLESTATITISDKSVDVEGKDAEPASGKLAPVDKDAEDGSENPYAVLAEDVDATSADAVAPLYLSGHFNAAALSFADGTVAADVADKARELGIYIA